MAAVALQGTRKNPNGHVLVSTKQYPTIITDQVGVPAGLHQAEPRLGAGLHRRARQAIDFLKSNPDKAFGDVTEYLGQSPEEIEGDDGDGADLVDEESRSTTDTADSPGPIYTSSRSRAQFWKSIGEITSVTDPNERDRSQLPLKAHRLEHGRRRAP